MIAILATRAVRVCLGRMRCARPQTPLFGSCCRPYHRGMAAKPSTTASAGPPIQVLVVLLVVVREQAVVARALAGSGQILTGFRVHVQQLESAPCHTAPCRGLGEVADQTLAALVVLVEKDPAAIGVVGHWEEVSPELGLIRGERHSKSAQEGRGQ